MDSGSPIMESFTQAAFRTPADAWRSVPFYSLNDELDTAELCRQLDAFKAGGMGGTFLHSRVGLLTPYLGGRWFEVIAAAVKHSQAIGIDAWFYDEDLWPSGFAGGIVPLQDPAFQARSLLRLRKDQAVHEPDIVLHEDENYRYVCHVFPMGDPRFNGTAWVDLLNPETVKAFIACSYVPYAERFAGQPHVPGIFTDEPQVSPRPKIPHEGAIAFSPVLIAAFVERNGYDVIRNLPSLFAQAGEWQRVRLDYYRTIAGCFETAFSKPIGDYCSSRGLAWTGHYNGEDSPTANMVNTGGLMQQYRHMQLPGIDSLGLNYGSVHCGKVMTSVANQYGRSRRLSELFGIAGHNLSFEDRMWIAAWHTIMGINFMCPHLSLYSMKGERKRDYPPTISSHQPWWRYNRLFEDYSARLCYFAGTGETVAEVCVLSPIESNYIEGTSDPSRQRDQDLDRLLTELMRTHRQFDLCDEQILSEIGTVDHATLGVGCMAYSIVVLPSMLTIRGSTLALLERFAAQGGTIFVSGAYPKLVDGFEDPSQLAPLTSIAKLVEIGGWRAALRVVPPYFTLSGDSSEDVWSHLRRLPDGYALQLSNTSRLESCTLAISADGLGDSLALLDPLDGRCLRLTPEEAGSCTLAFAPAQTWIITAGEGAAVAQFDADYQLPMPSRKEVLVLDGDWSGHRLDPNAITLDFARASLDGGMTWGEPEPVLAISDRFAHRQPYQGELRLKFEVDIEEIPGSCHLAVEQAAIYSSILVNGADVNFLESIGFFIDPILRTQDIQKLLRPGINEIVLALDFISAVPDSFDARTRYGTEIESIYLVGDFAVSGEPSNRPLLDTDRNESGLLPRKPVHSFARFTLTKESGEIWGDLATEGYPFYAGGFRLERKFELPAPPQGGRVLLWFPSFEAVVLEVEVNGRTFPPIYASPWEVDISDVIREVPNTLSITLTNSLRNLMGPHHHKGGEHTAVGPNTFRANDGWPNHREPGERDWYDARREGRAKLWRDDYYMIPFGFLEAPKLVWNG